MIDQLVQLDEFVDDVADMRLWQSRFYAATHGSDERRAAFHAARARERKVDDWVRRLRAARDHVPPPPEDRLL